VEVVAVEEALAVSQNRLLRGVIAALTSDGELDAVLASVIDLVTDATGGDVCVLDLWDPAQDHLVLRAASPALQSAVGEVRLRLGEGVTGWAAEHRQVVVIPEDKWADPRYKYFPELQGERYTSMISMSAAKSSPHCCPRTSSPAASSTERAGPSTASSRR
jgi:signal transduction protein with GAF and PtsI domain